MTGGQAASDVAGADPQPVAVAETLAELILG